MEEAFLRKRHSYDEGSLMQIPSLRSFRTFVVLVPFWLILSNCFATADSNENSEEALRRYVEAAVVDPTIFVMNPPAELRAYEGLSPAELGKRQMKAIENGSVLSLYPNGIPLKLESRKDFKLHGSSKSWYQDGTLQMKELYESDRLIEGQYYSNEGKLISEVKGGRGKKLSFDFDEGRPVIRSETEYLDGLKHGRGTLYRDYAKKQILEETEYLRGEKSGIQRSWMNSGQLNYEIPYLADKQEGTATYWHENGMIQSLSTYRKGIMVGNNSRYTKDGQKIEETIRDGEKILMQMKWYPDGALMTLMTYDPIKQRVCDAISYSRDGSVNGEVKNGEGMLVLADADNDLTFESFFVEIFDKEAPTTRDSLPVWSHSSPSSKGNVITLSFTASDVADFDELEGVIQPPDARAEAITIRCKPGEEVRDVKLPLPEDADSWVGTIYGQTVAKGRLGSFHFTQIIYSQTQEPSQNEEVSTPTPRRQPLPMYVSESSDEGTKVGSLSFPPLRKSLGAWTSEAGQWVIFSHPAAIIHRKSPQEAWVVMKEFAERPAGLLMLGNEHLLVWSTKATATPQKGIPYSVEESTDGGKTWKTFKIPQVDFLKNIRFENGVLIISGIRLPKDGLAPEKDWFELPQTHFLSSDEGQNFSEIAGISFLSIGHVISKSSAPDNIHRAYLSDISFQGSFYEIYLADGPDTIPRKILNVSLKPEMVWSENSQILALRHGETFFAYYDIAEGRSGYETLIALSNKTREPLTKKQKEEIREMDQKIRQMLGNKSE